MSYLRADCLYTCPTLGNEYGKLLPSFTTMQRGRQVHVKWVKIGDFRLICRYIIKLYKTWTKTSSWLMSFINDCLLQPMLHVKQFNHCFSSLISPSFSEHCCIVFQILQSWDSKLNYIGGLISCVTCNTPLKSAAIIVFKFLKSSLEIYLRWDVTVDINKFACTEICRGHARHRMLIVQ